MDLKIRDVAELLNVSETTIRRWLTDGKIPAYRINHQYRFNRGEIENWVMSNKLGRNNGMPTFKDEGETDVLGGGIHQFSLYRAIHNGGVLQEIPGSNKEAVIKNSIETIAQNMNLDSEMLSELILDRENLQPTALNNGIGIPHTRDTLLKTHHDNVTVVFPKESIEYGALDGQPVHTLFFLFACSDKRHLNLLAKIAHFSSDPKAQEFLSGKPSKGQFLDFVKEWESRIANKQ